MTNEYIADACVPIAARLVATVRDFGPDDVAAVLAQVPEGRMDALAVVLAAMVDPDKSPSELLAWTEAGPVQSRADPAVEQAKQRGEKRKLKPIKHGTPAGYAAHRRRNQKACARCLAAHSGRIEDSKSKRSKAA